MNLNSNLFKVILLILSLGTNQILCGPLAGAICSAGCAAVVVACYAAAGAVFGTVTAGAATPAAVFGLFCLFYFS